MNLILKFDFSFNYLYLCSEYKKTKDYGSTD